MEAINDLPAVRQERLPRRRERRAHVGAVRPHLRPLLDAQTLQAFFGRRLVASLGDRQDPRRLRIAEVCENRDVQLVPLLEADLVEADVRDHAVGSDPLRVLQTVRDDRRDHLRTDAEAAGHLFFGRADQHPQHVLFEPQRVGDVLAFERGQQPLPVIAPRTAMVRRLIDEERGLAPDVEIADDLDLVAVLHAGSMRSAAFVAGRGLGEIPFDFERMAVADALVTANPDAFRHIEIDFHRGHRRPSLERESESPGHSLPISCEPRKAPDLKTTELGTQKRKSRISTISKEGVLSNAFEVPKEFQGLGISQRAYAEAFCQGFTSLETSFNAGPESVNFNEFFKVYDPAKNNAIEALLQTPAGKVASKFYGLKPDPSSIKITKTNVSALWVKE